jgi:hypothetical protein
MKTNDYFWLLLGLYLLISAKLHDRHNQLLQNRQKFCEVTLEKIHGLKWAMPWFLCDILRKCATGSGAIQILIEFCIEDIKLQTFWLSLNCNIHKNKTIIITSNKYSSQSTHVFINNDSTMFHYCKLGVWSSFGHTSIQHQKRTPVQIVFAQVHSLLPRSCCFY